MSAAYRVNRIPVTDDIEDTVFNLIEAEHDIETKKKHPAKWYRTETAEALKLSENANPSLRSYENLVNEKRNYLKKPNPLDDPWSLGSLINYPIPQDKIIEVWTLCENLRASGYPIKDVPIDIEVWSLNLPDGPVIDMPLVDGKIVLAQFHNKRGLKLKWLTIRQVRWYVIISSISKRFEGNSELHTIKNKLNILMNALAYASYERQCEMKERPMITIDQDRLYFEQ
jgi:hypothetical protein